MRPCESNDLTKTQLVLIEARVFATSSDLRVMAGRYEALAKERHGLAPHHHHPPVGQHHIISSLLGKPGPIQEHHREHVGLHHITAPHFA